MVLRELDEREVRADERDRRADERERLADARVRLADARERVADEREWAADDVEARRYDDRAVAAPQKGGARSVGVCARGAETSGC